MTRQINLNQPDLLPGYGPVQLPVFVMSVLLAVLLAIGWTWFRWSEHNRLLAEEQEWITRADQALAELQSFQARNPNLANEDDLVALNSQLTEELRRVQETYQGLASQMENAIEGFGRPLLQLSDYDLDGLWLARISLRDGQRYFVLEGFARNPELIPEYLNQLSQSDYRGLSVDELSLSREADNSELWQFRLSNDRASNDRANSGTGE